MTDTNKITLPRSVVEQALEDLEMTINYVQSPTRREDMRDSIEAFRAALEQPQVGEVVVTTNQEGQCVAVTRQDEEGHILSVIWEAQQPQVEQEPVAWLSRDEARLVLWQAMHKRADVGIPTDDKLVLDHLRQQKLWIGKYTHPQNLNCKSTQARLATLWGYVKERPKSEQGPVAFGVPDGRGGVKFRKGWAFSPTLNTALGATLALYTHPQPPRQPLTDEWIRMIYDECDAETGDEFIFAFARAIERAHGIGGEA